MNHKTLPAKRKVFEYVETIKDLPAIYLTPDLPTNYEVLYDEIEACHTTKKLKLNHGSAEITKKDVVDAVVRERKLFDAAFPSEQRPAWADKFKCEIREEIKSLKKVQDEIKKSLDDEVRRLKVRLDNMAVHEKNRKAFASKNQDELISMPFNRKGKRPDFEVPKTAREVRSLPMKTIRQLADFYGADFECRDVKGSRAALRLFLTRGNVEERSDEDENEESEVHGSEESSAKEKSAVPKAKSARKQVGKV